MEEGVRHEKRWTRTTNRQKATFHSITLPVLRANQDSCDTKSDTERLKRD